MTSLLADKSGLLMEYRTLLTLMLILCVCIVCLHFHCLLCVWQSFIKFYYYTTLQRTTGRQTDAVMLRARSNGDTDISHRSTTPSITRDASSSNWQLTSGRTYSTRTLPHDRRQPLTQRLTRVFASVANTPWRCTNRWHSAKWHDTLLDPHSTYVQQLLSSR